MGPLPKRKVSKSRRNRRRAHDFLSLPNIVMDDDGSYRLAHHVNPTTGQYKGQQVVEVEEE